MKYGDLLLEVYNFREELSDDYSNLKDLLENNPSYIEICRICMGKSIKNFVNGAKITKRIYNMILKKKKNIPEESIENLISYIVKEFSKIKKEKIISSFSSNWVYVDNKKKCEKWIKYDQRHKFLLEYQGPIMALGYIIFFVLIAFYTGNINIIGTIMTLSFLFILIIFVSYTIWNSPPNKMEISFFIISAILKNNQVKNIDKIKKYIELISNKLCTDKETLRKLIFTPVGGVRMLFNEVGKTIQEHILPHIEEKNYGDISQYFDRMGKLIIEPNVQNLTELEDCVKKIEESKEYSFVPYIPPSKLESVTSVFKSMSMAKEPLLDFWNYFFKPSIIILPSSLVLTCFFSHYVFHRGNYLETDIFVALLGFLGVLYIVYMSKKR